MWKKKVEQKGTAFTTWKDTPGGSQETYSKLFSRECRQAWSQLKPAYMEKICSWPAVKVENGLALQFYALFLHDSNNAVADLLDMAPNLKIISKLPFKLRNAAYEITHPTSLMLWNARFCPMSDPIFGDIS